MRIIKTHYIKRKMWRKRIDLPELETGDWTVEQQVFKMLEELGEVSQALFKINDYEAAAQETVDLIQTGQTLLCKLEKMGIDINKTLDRHIRKLKAKGYTKEDTA